MTRFLRWFADFLDAKFPDKIEVRVSDMILWKTEMEALRAKQDELDKTLAELKANLSVINQNMGMSMSKFGMLER